MLYTESIERIVEVAIASEHVLDEENTRPLNIMLVTLSGGGKSSILLEKFGKVEGVKSFGDITYDQLAKQWLDKTHDGKVNTWIFSEFNKILGRKQSTARNTLTLIDEVCEEGCPSIDLPYFVRTWNPSVKANVILGLTPSFLNAHLIDWWGFGFAQRFLYVTWKYSNEQIEEILNYIKKQYHKKKDVYELNVHDRKIELPTRYADKIKKKYTMKITADMTDYVEKAHNQYNKNFDRELEKELPFRNQMRLQKFLKTIAFLNGHRIVEWTDYLEFKNLFRFMNLKFREPIQ